MKHPKTVNQIRNSVAHAWGLLERYCDSYRGDLGTPHRWLSEAEDFAAKGEREHRAMGARFTRGQASYRVPVITAARAIILNHVFSGACGSAADAKSWAYVAGFRRDCALAYAIRECLTPGQLASLAEGASVDYAEDIAS